VTIVHPAETKSDEMRMAFLDMVIHWLAAGLKVDGLITPQTKSAASDARHWP
jgi:hypothetical protein